MKKQHLIITVLVCLLCAMVSQPVCAGTYNETDSISDGAKPIQRFTYIETADQSFSINSNGKASIYALTTGKQGVDSVAVEANLQQLKNGVWTTIKTWSASKPGRTVTVSGEWNVVKGYSYRLQSAHSAYYNGATEKTTITSKTVNY